MFEGLGSYATVWVNGTQVGRHAGGLTTFTIDVTDAVHFDRSNVLAVRADHPSGIRDLPWVCGGCEHAYGFSEGTQPFGIFRPVHLVITSPVRVEPFGVHVWNDRPDTSGTATLHVRTEVKNHGTAARVVSIVSRLEDASGQTIAEARREASLAPGEVADVTHEPLAIAAPRLWSPENPYLYSLRSELLSDGACSTSPSTARP
ncbi:MAG TPA: hypothetical protein VGA56_21090 [Opitutaceae bacterium]